MLLLKEKATQDNSKYQTLAVPVRTVAKVNQTSPQIKSREKKKKAANYNQPLNTSNSEMSFEAISDILKKLLMQLTQTVKDATSKQFSLFIKYNT